MNSNIRKTTRVGRQDGMVMVACLLLLLMLSLIGVASIMTSNTDMSVAGNELHATEALYLADAGLERTLSILTDSTGWRRGFNNVALGHGTYSLALMDSTTDPFLGGKIFAHATGKVEQTEKIIEAYLEPIPIYPFGFGAYGRDSMRFAGNGTMDSYNSERGSYASQFSGTHAGNNGSIGSQGNINLQGGSQIYGDASTSDGSISYGGGAVVYGDTNSNAEPPEFPPITQQELDFARANSIASSGLIIAGHGAYNNINRTLDVRAGGSVTFTSGLYYFTSVAIRGGASILIPTGANVVVYVSGNWNSAGGIIVNSNHTPSSFQLYAAGDTVAVAGGSEFYGAIYAPESDVVVTGGSDFYGSIIGATFNNGGGTHCHYDEALGRNITRGITGYAIYGWKEM